VVRAQWWWCGEGTLSRHERTHFANQARQKRCESKFLVEWALSVQEWSQHTIYFENINLCTEFGLLEVKVPIIFLGTVGFSPRRGDVTLRGLDPKPQRLAHLSVNHECFCSLLLQRSQVSSAIFGFRLSMG